MHFYLLYPYPALKSSLASLLLWKTASSLNHEINSQKFYILPTPLSPREKCVRELSLTGTKEIVLGCSFLSIFKLWVEILLDYSFFPRFFSKDFINGRRQAMDLLIYIESTPE